MSIRTERMASMLQREVADILRLEFSSEISHMVTVTGVRITNDLSIATVHISVFGDTPGEKGAVLDDLKTLSPRIRGSLGRRIRHQVRSIPELKFVLDDSLAEAARLEELFGRIHSQSAPEGSGSIED